MEKIITIILSFRNEESNIPLFYNLVKKSFENQNQYFFEIMFIDDFSNDNSKLEIHKLYKKNKNIKYFLSKKNYGGSPSIKFGLKNVPSKNYACVIDCDMQDDPALILEGLKKTSDGQVTNFVRTKRTDGFFQSLYTKVAYKILNFISKNQIFKNTNHFKILSPYVISKINKNDLAYPYWNYLMSSFAKKNNIIYYIRTIRQFGYSKFNFFSKNPWITFLSGLNHFIKDIILYSLNILSFVFLFYIVNFFIINNTIINFVTIFIIALNLILLTILFFFNNFIKKNTFKKLNVKFNKIL